MITGVDRVLLRVQSLGGAVAYYRDILGLHLIRQEKSLAAFALGAHTELVLHDSPDLPTQAVYFRVDDLGAMFDDRERLKLKFTTPPRPTARGRAAAARDPFGNVLLLLDRAATGGEHATIESAAPASESLFAGVSPRLAPKRDALAAAYETLGRTADDLPYTHHFESLHAAYSAAFPEVKPTREDTWRHLLNLRKAAKLAKFGEARSNPPEITPEQREVLRSLLGQDIGRRDRLPYAPKFDELVEAFNRHAGLRLTPHQIWRLVATVAK